MYKHVAKCKNEKIKERKQTLHKKGWWSGSRYRS
jgi:hypothetical protein